MRTRTKIRPNNIPFPDVKNDWRPVNFIKNSYKYFINSQGLLLRYAPRTNTQQIIKPQTRKTQKDKRPFYVIYPKKGNEDKSKFFVEDLYKQAFPFRQKRTKFDTKWVQWAREIAEEYLVELRSQNGYTRRCHDCGRPTNNYRCDRCWEKIRKKKKKKEDEFADYDVLDGDSYSILFPSYNRLLASIAK